MSTIDGIPIYINPLIGKGKAILCLKDTPEVHIVADSFDIAKALVEQLNTIKSTTILKEITPEDKDEE